MRAIDPDKEYVLTAPVQYINRAHILEGCGKYISHWGARALVSGGRTSLQAVEESLFPALNEGGIVWQQSPFSGECCDDNILAIVERAKNMDATVIIGTDGGKSLDSAKAAAEICNIPVVCVPTIAATCAAASALSVIYSNCGEHERDQYLLKNPSLVLVDPEIIAHAPIKFMESGILDSLSKWYEGSVTFKGIDRPDVFTQSAIRLAALLNEVMEKDAVSAVEAVKTKTVTPALIAITDLNIYLAAVIQCIGKHTRGAAAHSIHAGLSVIPESRAILHGFKVGYGIIVQLFIERASLREIGRVANFCRRLDLEPSFRGLKLQFDAVVVRRVAAKSVANSMMRNMPGHVTVDIVVAAMEKAEELIGTL